MSEPHARSAASSLAWTGERTLRVVWPEEAGTADRIAAAYARLRSELPAGVVDLVPAYASLTLIVNAAHAGDAARRAVIESAAAQAFSADAAASCPARRLDVPFCADADDLAPDLAWLARHLGRSQDTILDGFTAATFRVAFLGFSPGFPYLTGLPPELHVPRRDAPRARVPAGSVAIAAAQAGIYPASTPGGWRILGRTPLRLFDASSTPPTLFQPGDLVRFNRITRRVFEQMAHSS